MLVPDVSNVVLHDVDLDDLVLMDDYNFSEDSS
jgi:hypothetical protein